jgi:hypothetical protein
VGYELRRVPLDFAAPLHVLWPGYRSPYRCHPCGACDNTGLRADRTNCHVCSGWGFLYEQPPGRTGLTRRILARAADAWRPTDPPRGPGYQLWETVSAGSPVTPPLADLDSLAEYAAAHVGSRYCRLTAEEWLVSLRRMAANTGY